MKRFSFRTVFFFAVATLLSACLGNGATPGSSTPGQAAFVNMPDDSTSSNLSGQYAGYVKDSVTGKGRLNGSLAQYKNALGGPLTATAATSSVTSANTWSIANGTDLTGSAAATVSGTVCVYSVTGKYDGVTHRLYGSYRAVHGCSGQKGTYTMKQQCYYARDWAIRKDTGLKQC